MTTTKAAAIVQTIAEHAGKEVYGTLKMELGVVADELRAGYTDSARWRVSNYITITENRLGMGHVGDMGDYYKLHLVIYRSVLSIIDGLEVAA